MELLNSIGLTNEDVRKISIETADSIAELDSLSTYALSENAPKNILETYNSLHKQIKRYLASDEFVDSAKRLGFNIAKGFDVEEEIVIAEIPKVEKIKTVAERIAERKGEKLPKVEAEIEEPIVDIEEVPAEIVEPIIEEIIESPIKEEVDLMSNSIFGVLVKGERGGEFTARDLFSMMLSYGRCDYILGMFEDSKGYHYRLDLPLSLGQVVVSFGTSESNSSHTSILSVWTSYVDDLTATMNITSRSKEQLNQLSDVLGFSAVTKYRLELSSIELKDEKFDENSYDVVGEEYAKTISGGSYYSLAKSIKISWENSVGMARGNSVVYGLNFEDYVYEDAESVYSKGGYTIVAKKYTFYVPKGLSKGNMFAEIGQHLKTLPIKTSKFEKDVAIGKRFQVSTGDFDKALSCRVVASNGDTIFIVDESGQGYKVSEKAFNYFKHYYGVETDIKISKSTLLIIKDGSVVGLIATTKFHSELIVGMFDYENFKKQLRTINVDAFDFMVSKKVEVVESTKVEIEKIEEKIEEGSTDESGLKEELEDRIEFLEELYDDAVEDGDNQNLIDELDMELETLRDLLEDIE
jgi:hypothetical protein